MPPILGLSFLCWKQGQVTSLTLLFDAIERFFFAIKGFLETHLAKSLFVHRRWRGAMRRGGLVWT